MVVREDKQNTEEPLLLGGGPLGYGDPDDLRLRRTERDVILPKLIREEARKRCPETLQVFLDCSKNAGLLVPFKCRKENAANNECILSWAKNPDFIKEITEKYLESRSYFRRTGQPVEKYERKKSPSSSFC